MGDKAFQERLVSAFPGVGPETQEHTCNTGTATEPVWEHNAVRGVQASGNGEVLMLIESTQMGKIEGQGLMAGFEKRGLMGDEAEIEEIERYTARAPGITRMNCSII